MAVQTFHGLASRIKGKIGAGLGLFNALYVGLGSLGGVTVAFGIFAKTGAPVNGTSGSFAGKAPPGSLLVRTDSPALYQNTGTLASPTWSAAPISGAAGITSGTIDGAVIGGSTPAAATVTTLTATGLTTLSAADAITASTTHTLVGATALTKTFNEITVCANSDDAVSLPVLAVGEFAVVFNAGANPAAVFPGASGDAIDGGSAGASVTLTNAKRCVYLKIATNKIISAQLGVVSA